MIDVVELVVNGEIDIASDWCDALDMIIPDLSCVPWLSDRDPRSGWRGEMFSENKTFLNWSWFYKNSFSGISGYILSRR